MTSFNEKLCVWCQMKCPEPAIQFEDETGPVKIHARCLQELQEMLWRLRKGLVYR